MYYLNKIKEEFFSIILLTLILVLINIRFISGYYKINTNLLWCGSLIINILFFVIISSYIILNYKRFSTKSFTNLDKQLIIFNLSSLMILALVKFEKIPLGLLILYLVVLLVYLVRITMYNCRRKEYNLITRTIYLYDIYHKNFENIIDSYTIPLNDIPKEKSLISYEDIANKIKILVEDNSQIIIGLEGEWGSGKTASLSEIIDNIKLNKRIKTIMDFDPWIFNDEESLFKAMLNEILKITSFGNKISQILDNFTKVIFSNHQFGFISGLLEDNKTYSYYKELIGNDLKRNNFKIVFILDNIERMQPHNILFIYKAIASALSITNISYILLYSPEDLKESLESQDIGYNYLNKIIHKKFQLTLSEKQMDGISKRIIFNAINHIKPMPEKTSSDLLEIIERFKFSNFRDLANYLNEIDWHRILYVNIFDYIILIYFKVKNIELYNKIKNNKSEFLLLK